MLPRFVRFNLNLSKSLSVRFPNFFLGNKNPQKDLKEIIYTYISKKKNLNILEIGGIDRPMLKKSPDFYYSGLDIEKNENCNFLYDNFIVQSIEEEIKENFDIIISSTLMEHVKNNDKSFTNIYNSLNNGGVTLHYIPSKNHFYSIILRIVGPRLQRKIIKNLRPQASLEVTGYPTFFHRCCERELHKLLIDTGFKDIKINPYFKAGDYFAFFTPLYLLITFLENFMERFDIRFFAAGLIVTAKK